MFLRPCEQGIRDTAKNLKWHETNIHQYQNELKNGT